ncbi:MAG: hypothetical protein EKK52_03935 [Burkholderiales bacterium]|nr:MAG: hypothetical protein EKK52_03935 [Burkholderiales bacterium]
MTSKFLFCALAAAGPLFTSSMAAAADAKVTLLSFSKGKEVPASITLLKRDGKLGRDNPFYEGYRPQLQFVGRPEVTCAIRIPKPQDKVEPGDTATVGVVCIDDFQAPEKDLSFVMLEGGRKVGEGVLKP